MDRIKYPRTPHLPWSQGIAKDDVIGIPKWESNNVLIVTEKMDGENTTIGQEYVHARSVDSGYHASRTWVKNWAADWQWDLAPGERICGENMYATHAIKYNQLPSYFLGISYWTDTYCHSWEDTLKKFGQYDIVPVPVWSHQIFSSLSSMTVSDWEEHNDEVRAIEGYVVRSPGGFSYDEFSENVMKWVRQGHVMPDNHWMHRSVMDVNGLKENDE